MKIHRDYIYLRSSVCSPVFDAGVIHHCPVCSSFAHIWKIRKNMCSKRELDQKRLLLNSLYRSSCERIDHKINKTSITIDIHIYFILHYSLYDVKAVFCSPKRSAETLKHTCFAFWVPCICVYLWHICVQ